MEKNKEDMSKMEEKQDKKKREAEEKGKGRRKLGGG